MKDFFKNLKIMKILYLLFFISFFGLIKSQEKAVPTDSKTLVGDQKILYQLLLECVEIKNPDKKVLHILPETYIVENSEKIKISIYYYGKDYYRENHYSPSMATYNASLTAEKDKPLPKGAYGTNNPNFDKTKPTYGFGIADLNVKKSRYSSPPNILTRKSDQPIFKNDLIHLSYSSNESYNKVDPNLYPQEFGHIAFVNKSFIIANNKGKYGVVSSKKEEILPFEYEQIQIINKDFLVKKESKFFIVNSKNEKVSDVFDEFIPLFTYSIIVQSNPELKHFFQVKIAGKANFIDWNYKILKPSIYDKLQFLKSGPLLFLAEKDHKQVIINYQSFKEISPRFDRIGRFDNVHYEVENNGKKGITDANFKSVLECIYETIEISRNSDLNNPEEFKLIVGKDKKYGAFHLGKKIWIADIQYDSIYIGEKYIIVNKEGKFGTLDLNGKIIIPIKYDSIEFNPKTKQTEAIRKGKISAVDFHGFLVK